MDRIEIFNIYRIGFTISLLLCTFLMIKEEMKRTDTGGGIDIKKIGTSECKGENIMMLIMMCAGMICLLWAVNVR